MATVTFDTLKFANRLKNAGIPSVHAEAEADALSEVFETNLSELATKEDLHHEIRELDTGLRHEMKDLETGLRHEIGDVRHEISDLRKDMDVKFEASTTAHKQEMSDLKFELLKWIIGITIAQAGFLIGILKFLP